MSATIRYDTWNVLNMQHLSPNSERWDYSDILGGGHMVEGVHHLRKAPNPHPQCHQNIMYGKYDNGSKNLQISI